MLNEAKIRAAKARSKPWKLTDSHRLFLLVTPNGSKLWKWSYQFDGKQKTMAFGDYPWVSLRDARETRRGRMDLDDGHDPRRSARCRSMPISRRRGSPSS